MDFIPQLADTLAIEDKVKLLDEAFKRIWDDESDEIFAFSEQDITLLQQYSTADEPQVRNAAIRLLSQFGPVNWDDAKQWMLDEDEVVRITACFQASTCSALSNLCESDKPKCAGLFAATAKQFNEIRSDPWLMCEDDKEWVDPFWSILGPLLDLGNTELNSNIICGILEDFLKHDLVTVDGPQVQSWIRGDSVERKMALLSVVQWFAMREPWQRKIAEALADDTIEIVASTARSFLEGKPVCDIQNRCWAKTD